MLLASVGFIVTGFVYTRNYNVFWLFIGAPVLIAYTLAIYKWRHGKGIPV